MRILIVGSGGREHALAWNLAKNHTVFVAPGNGGTALEATNVPLEDKDIPGLLAFAKEQNIDFVVPGPELPLTLGIVDTMRAAGIACFGPTAACARLEGSKAFAKEIMHAAQVPTAACGVFSSLEEARAFVDKNPGPIVVKADGLAGGKGVVVAQNSAEALESLEEMFSGRFGSAGRTVLVEEFLEGEEVSLLCLCDGVNALPLPSAQDHKAVFDNDRGPNTGGMGAYSPAPLLPDAQLEQLTDMTVRPVLRAMAERGTPFTGILYAGLMITKNGPQVLEYNVRFGDPECQPLLMRLQGDLAPLLLACCNGTLNEHVLALRPESALGVVVAAPGYPGDYPRHLPISGVEAAEASHNGVKVFHAGTELQAEGLVSNGGRVLCVTALGNSLADAQAKAYAALEHINMPGKHARTDIGSKGIRLLAQKEDKRK